jgi:hypothetical protein
VGSSPTSRIMEQIPYEEPKALFKIIQHHGDFLDGINGIVYHYLDEPVYDENHQYQLPTLESAHPWKKADIVCCERCKRIFNL